MVNDMMMNVIEISHPGNHDVLRLTQRPIPRPEPHEVLIEVAAAGVNRPDIMQRKGLYPPPPGASDIPGLEVAGIIIETGKAVTRWKNGDQVCALLSGGGYAQYCVAAATLCLPIPSGLDLMQAAALPETHFTVWENVFRRGKLRNREKFLVHGGAGGIGTTAIQLAAALCNVQIFTTCGSERKCRLCRSLGAHITINYQNQNFAETISQRTHGRGVDLILDIIGAPYLQANIQSLAVEGRLVIIAVQEGHRSEINLLPIFLKRLTLTGSTLRSRPTEEKALIAQELEEHVWPLFESGQIRPIIYATLPLSQASEAHRIMEQQEHFGKILLVP